MMKTNFCVLNLLKDTKVINMITKSVLHEEGCHFMKSATWSADLHQIHYFPNSEHSISPILILGIPTIFKSDTIRRAIEECLNMYRDYNVHPFYILLCVDRLPPVQMSPSLINCHWYQIPSTFWAQTCLIVPKENADIQVVDETPKDPLVALTWYLSQYENKHTLQSMNDPTVKFLNAIESEK